MYTFLHVLNRTGYYYIHTDTVKEILEEEKITLNELTDKLNIYIEGYFKALNLILIKTKKNGKQIKSDKPTRRIVYRTRIRSSIVYN